MPVCVLFVSSRSGIVFNTKVGAITDHSQSAKADLKDTNSTHTGIAYAHITAPHTCDYIGYVRHVGHAASSKNHM